MNNQPTSDNTSTMLIVLAVCFVGVFALGLYLGSTGMASGAAGVLIATAAARSKIKKMSEEAKSLSSSIASLVSESESMESHAESSALEASHEEEKSTRANIDTGESSWERTRIFPDA